MNMLDSNLRMEQSTEQFQLALNRARGNITDQVARYNRINLF